MIVFVYGSDIDMVNKQAGMRLEGLRSKRPDAGFFRMDDETFDEVQFEELIFSQGLFDKKFIVHLHRVMENKEAREFILKHLKELADSENAFVVSENKLAKPTFTKLEKVSVKTEVFEEKVVEKKTLEFNIFALGDALARKDKKNLWVLYTQALHAGLAPEQIHGTLFTQIKNIALIKRAEKEKVNTGDLGLHPYVVTKTKGFAKNFEEKELEQLSRDLLHLYHNARGGGDELDVGLERFVLNL
jgi:DNA polymerase III delta subunit